MLGGVKLVVNVTREQTCFAYISSKYCTNPNAEGLCVQIQVGENHVYMWAVFLSSVPEGSILVNPLCCRLLSLSLGRDVYVTTSPNIRILESLYIEADSNEDQVILEHNQTQCQNIFLSQVKLVVANQKAVIWLSPSMPIVFTPKQTGLLVNHSNVIVRMDILDPRTMTPQISPREEEKQKNSYNAMKGLLRPLVRMPKKLALRALPIEGDGKKDLIHPYTVFMHEDLVEEQFQSSPLIVALMKSLPSMIPYKKENENEEMFWRHELCVEVVPVNSVVFRSLCREVYSEYIPTILIPKSLNKIINVENGTMIMLTFIDSSLLRQPQHIEIITYTNQNQHESEMALIDRFKTMVVQNTYSGKAFIINHDMVKQNKQLSSGYIKFKLSPEGLAYTTMTQDTFRFCTISARNLDQSEMKVRNSVVSMDYDYKNYCRTIKPLELLIERVISHIYFDIHREARFNKCSDLKSSVLVTGLSGTGKSSLCNIIEKEISVFAFILRCRPLKGRKDIGSVFAKAIAMCTDRKPSLLILDDFDALVPPNMEGLSPQDIITYKALAVEIKLILSLPSGVSIMMTAHSVSELHPVFQIFVGQPLFTSQFSMPELGQEDRVQLFQHLVTPKVREQFQVDVDDVIRLAMDTSGSTMRDINDYFIRKIFAAIKKKNANPRGPKPRIIEDVTKDVDKAKAFDIWGPLGGMDDVKEKLNECIFWPIMYPALFPSQSCGILLYGPPGTGKSLIGSCLARLSNMNMITVKGPELLSKYIGQSEAAVREVFDRADTKRPCILFFDEFDSLAPKRGHDSTGVTDRVVNQLLARLDGAEGGARGPVIAATSRPDLIDPALLRTGRLSTHIYCELPGLNGRYEILRTIAKDFYLRRDVNLQLVAEATDGYSAADLKSLLVTAQLSRLEAELFLMKIMDDIDEPKLETVVITPEDITSSLEDTKPSLNKQQRKFYDSVYRRFRGEGPIYEELPSVALQRNSAGSDLDRSRMRVTLA